MPRVGRMTDRGVVPRMATKATSRPEGGPRLVRSQDEKRGRTEQQGRAYLPDHLVRVNDAAKRSRQTRFTALLHHMDVEALERAFRRLRREAVPGVDGMTVEIYEGRLADNLRELCDRVHGGRYKRCRFAGRTSPRLTAESGLSASSSWRTRSSKARWRRC
jgi:hypothetical protein